MYKMYRISRLARMVNKSALMKAAFLHLCGNVIYAETVGSSMRKKSLVGYHMQISERRSCAAG